MKISGSQNGSGGSFGAAGGLSKSESRDNDVILSKMNDRKNREKNYDESLQRQREKENVISSGIVNGFLPEPSPALHPVSSFRIFSKKLEEDGYVRFYIGDGDLDQYFELFVWVIGGVINRIDIHYDIHRNERCLTWNQNQNRLIHTFVNPEKEKDFSRKKTQTFDGTADLNLKILMDEFNDRYEKTLKIRATGDEELIEVIRFIRDVLAESL